MSTLKHICGLVRGLLLTGLVLAAGVAKAQQAESASGSFSQVPAGAVSPVDYAQGDPRVDANAAAAPQVPPAVGETAPVQTPPLNARRPRGSFTPPSGDQAQGARQPFSRRPDAAAATAGDGVADALPADGGSATGSAAEPAGGSRRAQADEDTVQRLVMRDQGLPDVLNYLELLTKKSVLRSQTLPAVKITFDSAGPMSRAEAILAVESLLALNGIAILPMGDRFLRAVQANEAARQSPVFITDSSLGLPASQQLFTKYFSLEYLNATNEGLPIVAGLLSPSGRQDGNPVVFAKSNSILVTDMLMNLQRIEEVLTKADQPKTPSGSLHFYELKHVKADVIKQRLTALIGAKDSAIASAFSYNTLIEADERTNQLIVVTHDSNLELLGRLIKGLDSDVEPQTGSEVFYIKHAVAEDIQALLQSVITGQQQSRQQAAAQQNQANMQQGAQGQMANLVGNQPPAPLEVPVVAANALTVGDTRNLQFSDYVSVNADERANAIVAYGTKSDLKQIGELIDKIDILLAQVNIQVIIAEVTLNDGFTNGIDQITAGYDAAAIGGLTGVTGWQGGAKGSSTDGVGTPFAFTGTLDPSSFYLILSNSRTRHDVRILSSPVIVTTHNKEAEVNVTESRPLITGTVTDLSNAGTTSNSVSYQDIGIKLKVKPLIGNNGIIQMEIEQRVESIVGNTTINGNSQPIIGKREAVSYVSVSDGGVVVLAGLQESSVSDKDNKLWLIGDIPLLGDLLNGRGKTTSRRELMIFIQPFVMTTDAQIADQTKRAIEALDNREDVEQYLETRNMSDVADQPEAKVTTEARERAESRRGPRR